MASGTSDSKHETPQHTNGISSAETRRLDRKIILWLRDSAVIICVAALLVIVMLTALLSLDLPFRVFDVVAGYAPGYSPSNWHSAGSTWMLASVFILMMTTRRFGGRVSARAHGLSWLLSTVITGLFLVGLLSELTPEDMPASRFVLSFLLSWYLAQALAIRLYDLQRGGVWWQAPLVAGLVAFFVQSAIFFLTGFAGKPVPWGVWFLIDLLLKSGAVFLFLPIYWVLRRNVRSYLGDTRYHTP